MNTLTGFRILNTRPLGQNKALSQAITDAGGISIELPALAIKPTPESWFKKLPAFPSMNHIIFTSANAVNYFFKPLKPPIAWPSTLQTTAIGHATATALTAFGITVNNVPSIADSEHVLQLKTLQQVQDQTIVLVKGTGGRMDITNHLKARGANLISVDVYRRDVPQYDQAFLDSLWRENMVDIILVTSQQALYNIFTLLGAKANAWLCSKPCLVISERIAETAFKFGMQTVIICHYDTILNALERYYQGLTHDYKQ